MEAIKQIKSLLDKLQNSGKDERIGIAITTHNRYEVFQKTCQEWRRFLPVGAVLAVVDDASDTPVPEADYRFETNVGIARAKNKCFELLYEKNCEHIFLVDDDTYPLVTDWHKPYIESPFAHLMYIFKDFSTGVKLNDTTVLYKGEGVVAYSHPRGCMLYYRRSVLDRVGGMDPVFGKWGYEHGSLSDRIYNAGLTPFRYMDVMDSQSLFYSLDEHQQVTTTVKGQDRAECIEKNKKIYERSFYSDSFIPFSTDQNAIITTYFTNITDTQRGAKWEKDAKLLDVLCESAKSNGCRLIVLSDCLTSDELKYGEVIKVDTSINPYFQRWVSILNYLTSGGSGLKKVFCVDATDVEVLHHPFGAMTDNLIYIGDEVEKADCDWIKNNHKSKHAKLLVEEYGGHQLMNAGLIGGNAEIVKEFIRALLDCYYEDKLDSTDMAIVNWVARSYFNCRLFYGREVCTVFKANERNKLSWFKHK